MDGTREAIESRAIEVGTDERLQHLFGSDPVRAKERFDNIRDKLIRFFACNFCADAEGLAAETFARATQALSIGKPLTSTIEVFLRGIAKNVLLEDFDRRRREALPLEKLLPGDEPNVHPEESLYDLPSWKQDIYHECLEDCFKKPKIQRDLILSYYEGNEEGAMKENRKRLADSMGVSVKTLRQRMLKQRERLEKCIDSCVRKKSK